MQQKKTESKEASALKKARFILPTILFWTVSLSAVACTQLGPTQTVGKKNHKQYAENHSAKGKNAPSHSNGGATANRATPNKKTDGVLWHRVLGANPKAFTAAQRRRAARLMKKVSVYYGCSDSIVECMRRDPESQTARRLAGFILRIVARGKPDHYVYRQVMFRARTMHPLRKYKIFHDARFCTADFTKAKVVVSAFSEFMCPVCSVVLPWLRGIVSSFGPKVALCYKFFPTSSHGRAGVLSCSSAAAAGFQGKFWNMHDLLYKNRKRQRYRHIIAYARKLGLQMKRFTVDRDSLPTIKMVMKDKRLGYRVGVHGTPTIFINGKRYRGWKNRREIADRIAEELHLVSGGH